MSVDILKQQIKSALERGKDAEQTIDNGADIDDIRNKIADDIASAVQTYVKSSLVSVIGGGVPAPQDGGTSLKLTMTAKITSI